MGRAPCCDKSKMKRGPWSPEEDTTLRNYVHRHGTSGSWIALPHKAGLKRCGKSCRLRWLNYLRPNIKHGGFTEEEDALILTLYHTIGSRWSMIASQLPGRTDNDIKNYWNTKLKKRFFAAAASNYTSATNTITCSSRNTELDNMSYFAVDHQIPLPALIEAPENPNNSSLLRCASSSLSPPFVADNMVNANGSCEEDNAFLVELGCGLMSYDLLNAFDTQEDFNLEINNMSFGFNNAQEEQTNIYISKF